MDEVIQLVCHQLQVNKDLSDIFTGIKMAFKTDFKIISPFSATKHAALHDQERKEDTAAQK